MASNGCTVAYLPIPLAWLGWAGLVEMTNGGWAEMRQEQSALRRWALGVGRWGRTERVWGLVETRGHVCWTRDGTTRGLMEIVDESSNNQHLALLGPWVSEYDIRR
jgi:hypothetical protein